MMVLRSKYDGSSSKRPLRRHPVSAIAGYACNESETGGFVVPRCDPFAVNTSYMIKRYQGLSTTEKKEESMIRSSFITEKISDAVEGTMVSAAPQEN